MPETLTPPLTGLAQARFVHVGIQLRNIPSVIEDSVLRQIIDRETSWAESPAGKKQLRGEVAAYRASIRALLDLVRIGWKVEVERGTLELSPPERLRERLSPEQVKTKKEETRRLLWPLVAEQLAHPEFQKFVRRMERPSPKTNTLSILNLIADPKDLVARLKDSKVAKKEERSFLISKAIAPYLQLVTEGQRDIFSNHLLSDIWRYFRSTWAIPNLSVPGRSLLYLIRDASHKSHAVMGLIALNNAPMRKKSTDDWVGWTPGMIRFDAEEALRKKDPKKELNILFNRCLKILRDGISGICPDDLISKSQLENPSLEVARHLLSLGNYFDELREKALKDLEIQNTKNVPRRNRKAFVVDGKTAIPPLNDDLPDLEKGTPDEGSRFARRLLVAKKRAHELSSLIQAQVILESCKESLTSPQTAHEAWSKENIATSINVVCSAMKSARLSSNLLEVTTCGSIAPYNELLGGKLAALLCFSPEIAADYQKRYGGQPAIIRSHMANKPVPADCRLASLVTTSLYSAGSSQYERVKLPAGVICPDQPELKIQKIGLSSGFGTVQFSTETANEINEFARTQQEYIEVNSVFGEGPSPKLRKLRAGLDLLGFSADSLLRHHQARIVYAFEYWSKARDFLKFGDTAPPSFVIHPEKYRGATESICKFWIQRWLSMRLDHPETWNSLTSASGSWALSDRLPLARNILKSCEKSSDPEIANLSNLPPSGRCVFERLAEKKGDLYSERLTEDDLEKLHVSTPLDKFILEQSKKGISIVLTGNAGDGKSHLIRRLAPHLAKGVEIINDATAEMDNGKPDSVLNRIKKSLSEKKGAFVLAANEHQLLKLREAAKLSSSILLKSIFSSIDLQCKNRLAYGTDLVPAETFSRVVVLDLSLRNPLAPSFVGLMFKKLFSDEEVKARASQDQTVARNIKRMSHPQVQKRLMSLFERLVLRGERATIRQLWMVLCRSIFPPELSSAGDSLKSWYSEQLFNVDGSLEIDRALTRFADPSANSHPIWDWNILEEASPKADDWIVDGPPTGVNLNTNPKHWFNAYKRRFYFEHLFGDQIFNLESRADREFRALLHEKAAPDPSQIGHLLRGLNRLYCPSGFTGEDTELFLWQGLRYHEQPSRAYLASDSIHKSLFRLVRPKIHNEIAVAFSAEDPLYIPNHLRLIADLGGSIKRFLKIDYYLFATLLKVSEGLPRHLVPESHIHRVDAFIERIGSAQTNKNNSEFRIFNAEDGSVAKITITSDKKILDSSSVINL